jgi:hypothetical protein
MINESGPARAVRHHRHRFEGDAWHARDEGHPQRRPDRIESPASGVRRAAMWAMRRSARVPLVRRARCDAAPRGAPVRRARASSSRALARKIGAGVRSGAVAVRPARRASTRRGFGRGFLARVVPARRSSLAPRRSQGVRSPDGRRTGRRSRNTVAIRRPRDVTGARSGAGSDRRRCSYVSRFELLLAAGQRPSARRTGADDGIRSARPEAERPPILSSAAPPPSLTIGDGLM